MVQLTQPARGRLQITDIGAWLFRCNAKNLALDPQKILSIESRCAVRNYRLDLIRPGHPVVLWRTGPTRATPPPGVWVLGYATGDIRDDPGEDRAGPRRAQVLLTNLSTLATLLPRADISNHPGTASMEVLRRPFGPNPSYLTPAEQIALQQLIGGWPGE
jgi:hypothetical protein